MFNDEELKEYETLLNKIGIVEKEEQVKVLEFLYRLGIVVYKK